MLYRSAVLKFLLVKFQTVWEKEPTKMFRVDETLNESDYNIMKEEWKINDIDGLHPYLVELHESECLKRNNAYFIITKKGRDELRTTYNSAYVRKEQVAKLAEKRERDVDRKEQKLQHKEMVQVAKDANKWTKKGMYIAMFVGGLGLVVAVIGIIFRD